jgi:hypothetical protein
VYRCRHCPVPAVYGGRLRVVQQETLLADVDQLVEMGAMHLSFADPDFLNAAPYALRAVRSLHQRHPGAARAPTRRPAPNCRLVPRLFGGKGRHPS